MAQQFCEMGLLKNIHSFQDNFVRRRRKFNPENAASSENKKFLSSHSTLKVRPQKSRLSRLKESTKSDSDTAGSTVTNVVTSIREVTTETRNVVKLN